MDSPTVFRLSLIAVAFVNTCSISVAKLVEEVIHYCFECGRNNHDAVAARQEERRIHLIAALSSPVLDKILAAIPNPETASYDTIVGLLKQLYEPKSNYITQRHMLAQLKQKPGQSFMEFYTNFMRQFARCEYLKDFQADNPVFLEQCRARDGLISGLASERQREKLLDKGEGLTLDELKTICLLCEQNERDMANYASSPKPTQEVHAVSSRVPTKSTGRLSPQPAGQQPHPSYRGSKTSRGKRGANSGVVPPGRAIPGRLESRFCRYCGQSREQPHTQRCPVRSMDCRRCGDKGHLADFCLKPQGSFRIGTRDDRTRLHELEGGDDAEEDGSFPECELADGTADYGSLECIPKEDSGITWELYECGQGGTADSPSMDDMSLPDKFFFDTYVEDQPVRMQLDTGAHYSVIPLDCWRKLGSPKLRSTTMTARAFNGTPVEFAGRLSVRVGIDGLRGREVGRVPLLVSTLPSGTSTIGLDWPRIFKHIDWRPVIAHITGERGSVDAVTSVLDRTNALLSEFRSLFDGELGNISGVLCRFRLKPNTQPRICNPRQVPHALREPVERELERLVASAILKPVDQLLEPAECVTPIIPIRKPNGSVRVCGDFKLTLNSHLAYAQHPLPRIDDIYAQLQGGEKFSKIDLKDAFLQISVAPEAQKYLVITCHNGQFFYTRMPFGISIAPGVQQRTIESITAGLSGVVAFVDDICVTGRDDEEHLKNLRALLERCKERGVKLSREKCTFLQDSVECLGFIIDRHGQRPNPAKVAAVRDAPQPKDLKQLRSFLGMVNVYHKFIPDVATKAAPLYTMTRKNLDFVWTTECEQSFESLKKELVSPNVLVHYDSKLPLGLVTDASAYGISAVLFHIYGNGSERPIFYWSRTLSPAERNYSNIEHEAMALYEGVMHSHMFVFGRRFFLFTDHQPLTTIFGEKKGLPRTSASRLQRWAIALSGYDYEVKYRQGTKMGNADALSRLPIETTAEVLALCPGQTDFSICALDPLFEMEAVDWESRPLSARDVEKATQFDAVMSQVRRYTQHGWPDKLPAELHPFKTKCHEFTVDQGVVLWGSRVVIPGLLQDAILRVLHIGHPGMVRMKCLARSYVWWPGINSDIESTVAACTFCHEQKSAPPPSPIHPWEYPDRNWQRVHIDYAGPFQDRMFLCVVDARSKWPEIIALKSATSETTISALRLLFARYGIPEQLVSDNGPQFSCAEFAEFCHEQGIHHVFSSPYHPRTNGQAESLVKTFKQHVGRKKIPYDQLLRNLSDFLLSYRNTPHGTTERSPAELFLGRRLSTTLDRLLPKVESTVKKKQQQMASRIQAPVREFHLGQAVQFLQFPQRKDQKWIPAVIWNRRGPLTYTVRTLHGLFHKRHVDHIRARFTAGVNGSAPLAQGTESKAPMYDPQYLPVLPKPVPVVPTALPRVPATPKSCQATQVEVSSRPRTPACPVPQHTTTDQPLPRLPMDGSVVPQNKQSPPSPKAMQSSTPKKVLPASTTGVAPPIRVSARMTKGQPSVRLNL